MTADVDGDKELLEPNGHLLGQIQGANNSVAAEHLSAEEDGVKINRAVNGIKAEVQAAVPTQPLLQLQQQQSQGASVHWERFLHLRSLRVLLVENDDSTRHVVSALLRNCSYEVIEASNALQAWKVLEDLTNHIDLILTEVVMPFFSGIALLSKIMSHKTRKNVPVIMMSSHDSMGLVFKCLSKGAVDFLVKPIRKNELKNLWQHVWRRCHSSSGSGSESGTQTQKSIKSKSIERSGNNIGSNDEEDNGSTGLNVGDGSDSGSGTQSSWTKQAVQIGSPQPPSPWDHIAECADSTCAQVIHSNAETSQNNQGPAIVAMKCEELENSAIDGDLEVGLPRNLNLPLEHPIDVQLKPTDFRQNNLPGKEKMENGNLVLNRGSPSGKERYETNNLAGIVTDGTDPQREITEIGGPDRISASDTKNVPNGYIENIELSLKRSRAVKDAGTKVNDDRNVLRRSDSSAFSRYNTGSHKYSLGNSVSGSGSPEGNNSKREPGHDKQCHYEGDPPNQCSNVGSNNIDMCSTTNRVASVPASMKTLSMATSIVQRAQPSSYFHQLKGDMAFTPQQVVKEKTEEGVAKAMLTQRGTQQETQMQLHHHCRQLDHHFDQHDRLLRDVEQQQLPLDPEELSLKILAASAPHCGSSNVLGGNVEGNAGNYSINGSASGSNHGSNGPNGSSVAANAGGINLESDNGNAGKSGRGNAGGSGSGSGSGTEADQNKCAQREAALKKFRQKRNERCFRKKVRYQSRKKLAEQRPRVRGQFVRKTADDKTSEGTDS